jgi:hypothetical protein
VEAAVGEAQDDSAGVAEEECADSASGHELLGDDPAVEGREFREDGGELVRVVDDAVGAFLIAVLVIEVVVPLHEEREFEVRRGG